MRELALESPQTLSLSAERMQAVDTLLSRRSVSPRRLGGPAPGAAVLEGIVRAGLRGPDHLRLVPWRVIRIPPEQRGALASLFEAEKLRRDPLAGVQDAVEAGVRIPLRAGSPVRTAVSQRCRRLSDLREDH